MVSSNGTLDEMRVITSSENESSPETSIAINSLSDSRLVGFTTNDRDDNNGGGGDLNLVGINTGGVENFTVFEIDTASLAGQLTTGAMVTIATSAFSNANHGNANDSIVLNTLATTNAGFVTGTSEITGADNLTDDGSISFLNRIQYNDSPGPPSGTTQPWFDDQGSPVANILGAITQAGSTSGFAQGDSAQLNYPIDQATAQSWIDNGLIGFVVSAVDDGDSRSRFLLSGAATVVFQIQEASIFAATDFSVFRGNTVNAALGDFSESDDAYGEFTPGFILNSAEAPVWLIFDAVANDPAELLVESSANTPGLASTVEAFNWSTSSYDVIGVTPESFNSDATNEYEIDPEVHVDAGGEVRSRVGWRQVGFTLLFPWQVRVDQVAWVQ